jgi:DNA-binding CsgD family transcriptional regulator
VQDKKSHQKPQSTDQVVADYTTAPRSGPAADANASKLEELLREAERLHEAALDPARWPDVVRAAQQRMAWSRRAGELSPDQATWLQSMIDNATRVCAEAARLEMARAAVASARDALPLGILVLDGQRRVLRANPAAERLGRLDLLVASLPAWPETPSSAPVLTRIARDSFTPLEVLAVPVRAAADPYSFPDARTLLFIVDPDADQGPDEATLAVAFELTPAEARMAARLAQGDTVEGAARALGIRITTARTHLARIFLKTGTTRQPELVRMLLSVSTAARSDD